MDTCVHLNWPNGDILTTEATNHRALPVYQINKFTILF